MNWLRVGTATLRAVQSGIIALIDRAQTITGLYTFSRGTGAPFAVANSSAAVVTNLDADKLDGSHASAFSVVFTNSAQLAALLSDETGYSAGAFVVFSISPTLTTPNLGTPSAVILTNATGLPTAGLVDAAVTLAKMANLAQDQFIGRVTASTGVPETATITAAARTVLDDATAAAMVDTLGGAAAVGSGGLARATSPVFATQISTPAIVAPVALTITPAAGEGVTVALSSIGGVLNVNGLLIGGLGSRATAGTLDWNDATNARPGSGNVLLRDSTASNAPASSASTEFRQSFSFEHLTKDATGNITQLAIPYGLSTSMDAGLYMRGRFSAVWGSWLRILSEDSAGVVAMLGTAARTVQIDRNLTANTAGYALTVKAGGATSGATDKAGGDLLLQPGLSTGSAESGVQIYGVVAGASGTADRTQTKAIQVLGNKIGFFNVTPVVRPSALTAALTALTHTAPGTPDYAIQNLTNVAPFGFVTADEGNTVLSVIVRLQTRLGEVETKLQALGLLT